MLDGVVLSIFDDKLGFVPVSYFPSNLKSDLINDIVLRATLFTVTGADSSFERESLIDLREDGVIGVTYMSVLDCPEIRGGKMPVVLINFTPNKNRYALYRSMIDILHQNKETMEEIKSKWTGTKFPDIPKISENLKDLHIYFTSKITESIKQVGTQDIEDVHFTIKCPECSNEAILNVPKNIDKLLAIPVINLPCEHEFEAYFTKGPSFRGTSAVVGKESKKDDLRDIFDLI